MLIQFILLAIGLTLLWAGAELLIRHSSSLARSMGVSPVIIGLTVVSMGTSLPEFVVSLIAALQNTMGISLGNIIGSNIANICLILGLGAIITDLQVKKNWVYKEVPFMLLSTLIFIIFSRTLFQLDRLEGLIMLVVLIIFLAYLSRISHQQIQQFSQNQQNHRLTGSGKKLTLALLSVLGMLVLVAGSKLTVDAGIKIANMFSVSDAVIGLTLIAVGTSLPELATTIVGCLKKETDIVVGNVIGSNIFNLLFIGGFVALIKPIPVAPELFGIEFSFLALSSVLIWPIMRFRWKIHRVEGIILISLFMLFTGLTFLAS